MKRCLLAWLAVFFVWAVLDLIGHGIVLGPLYAKHPNVFRPRTEMKIPLIYLGVLLMSGAFVGIYERFVANKSVSRGLQYGLLYGIGTGAITACGGFAAHPIHGGLAIGWYVISLVECLVGGWLVAKIVRDQPVGPSLH